MDYSLESRFRCYVRHRSFEARLSNLPKEWTENSETPDAWTPYEVVGHLAYVEESDWIDSNSKLP